MHRIHLPLLAAAMMATAAPASAASETRSRPAPSCAFNIGITAIEFKNTGFMDYTDDACMAFAPR